MFSKSLKSGDLYLPEVLLMLLTHQDISHRNPTWAQFHLALVTINESILELVL